MHGGTGAASYPVAALIRLMIPAAPHYVHLSSTRYSPSVRGNPFIAATPSRYLQGRHRWQVVSSPVPALPWGGFPGNDAHSGTPAEGRHREQGGCARTHQCDLHDLPDGHRASSVYAAYAGCSLMPTTLLPRSCDHAEPGDLPSGFWGPASKCHHRWIRSAPAAVSCLFTTFSARNAMRRQCASTGSRERSPFHR